MFFLSLVDDDSQRYIIIFFFHGQEFNYYDKNTKPPLFCETTVSH